MSRQFGTTWWGRAWVQALERCDPSGGAALRRGRAAARRGAVHELELHEGHLAARVVGRHGELHALTIAVRPLADSEWEQVAEAIAARAAHMAALLDGELDPEVVADAREVDVELLPSTADLRPDCACDEYASPCTHAAAASYLVADELDRDPFVLLLLRGRTRSAVRELVRAARGESATHDDVDAEQADPSNADAATDGTDRTGTDGVTDVRGPLACSAADVWRDRSLDDPPAGPVDATRHVEVPTRPGVVAPWDADPPPRHGVDPRRVDDLARDAVQRAWATLVDGAPTGVTSSARADLARRAVDRPDLIGELASLGGVTPSRLRVWSDAWARFGDVGVTIVTDPSSWGQDPEVLEWGRRQLVSLGMERRAVAVNYDSLRCAPETWFVVGPDRAWYRLAGSDKHQDVRLAAGPAPDPSELIELSP